MIRQIDRSKIARHCSILTAVMQKSFESGLVWFRRDLRVEDNPTLEIALRLCTRVHCVFVFDLDILDPLPRMDRRVAFIRESLVALDARLRNLSGKHHAGIIVLHQRAVHAIPHLAQELGVQAVFAARDYEPLALSRDQAVQTELKRIGIELVTRKDHVIFEGREILTQSGKPYRVFTPYLRAWMARLESQPAVQDADTGSTQALAERPLRYAMEVPTLQSLGFQHTEFGIDGTSAGSRGAEQLLSNFWKRLEAYPETRDFPSVNGPSHLGVHLRFGTVSIRHLVDIAMQRHLQGSTGALVWLNELVWRDFYFQILANFPHVAVRAFKPEYDLIQWEQGKHAQADFFAWCQGMTGYPLIDAAMLQLNQSGYMHNRLRMLAASFLVKHLGIDWRWGERYFAEKLIDFDLSANNGGWQWVSSSGCDAQPYFRIFNPITQSQKFDAQGTFIKRYLPQLKSLGSKFIHAPWLAKPLDLSAAGITLGRDYPRPIVDHTVARANTLQRYAVLKKLR
jgi:deoxyribodipyrimidine photo-lyase